MELDQVKFNEIINNASRVLVVIACEEEQYKERTLKMYYKTNQQIKNMLDCYRLTKEQEAVFNFYNKTLKDTVIEFYKKCSQILTESELADLIF